MSESPKGQGGQKVPTAKNTIRQPIVYSYELRFGDRIPMDTPQRRAQGDSTIIFIRKQQHTRRRRRRTTRRQHDNNEHKTKTKTKQHNKNKKTQQKQNQKQKQQT